MLSSDEYVPLLSEDESSEDDELSSDALDELDEDEVLEEVPELSEDEDLSEELLKVLDEPVKSVELITMLSGTLSESGEELQPAQSSNIGSSAARRFKYFLFIPI